MWSGDRRGFTVVEILIALVILMVAFVSIAGLAANITRKTRTPNLVDQATFLAVERLTYFRSQVDQPPTQAPTAGLGGGLVNGYVAAGGTYYPPPLDPRAPDFNSKDFPDFNNDEFNKVPTLLVREYLYDATESMDVDLLGGQGVRKRRYIPDTTIIRNEIPPTPFQVGTNPVTRVFPNPESGAIPANVIHADPTGNPNPSIAIPAPRANDHLRGVGFFMNDPALRFVREVWVQPMHPNFLPATLVVGAPDFRAAPPYSVVVTVRVYKKEFRVNTYASTNNAATPQIGLGYDPLKTPLAEMFGYVGLP